MFRYALSLSIVCASVALAQNPLSTEVKASYTRVKNNILKAAEKMPEEAYAFKPADGMETFGQRLAHIVDSNAGTCGRIKGEQKQIGARSKTSKADLVAATKESFAFCDAVFDAMTDADAQAMIQGRGGQASKLSSLYGVVAHSNEIYGYISVYMRLKGIVPPSSEGR